MYMHIFLLSSLNTHTILHKYSGLEVKWVTRHLVEGKLFHKANLTASTAAPWFKLIKDINGKCLKL